MSDDEIHELINELRAVKQKFDRQQRFRWVTRHLTPEERQRTEKRLRELWNASR